MDAPHSIRLFIVKNGSWTSTTYLTNIPMIVSVELRWYDVKFFSWMYGWLKFPLEILISFSRDTTDMTSVSFGTCHRLSSSKRIRTDETCLRSISIHSFFLLVLLEDLKWQNKRSTWITCDKWVMLQTLWDTRYLLDPLRPWSNSTGWPAVGTMTEKERAIIWLRVSITMRVQADEWAKMKKSHFALQRWFCVLVGLRTGIPIILLTVK
jgi:hypothetical protein